MIRPPSLRLLIVVFDLMGRGVGIPRGCPPAKVLDGIYDMLCRLLLTTGGQYPQTHSEKVCGCLKGCVVFLICLHVGPHAEARCVVAWLCEETIEFAKADPHDKWLPLLASVALL